MVSQYCAVLKMPVRKTNSSRATVASTATTVNAVYSGIGLLTGVGSPPVDHPASVREHLTDRLVRQQPTHRDHQEEDELLQRHPEDQLDTGDVRRVVVPVLADDP